MVCTASVKLGQFHFRTQLILYQISKIVSVPSVANQFNPVQLSTWNALHFELCQGYVMARHRPDMVRHENRVDDMVHVVDISSLSGCRCVATFHSQFFRSVKLSFLRKYTLYNCASDARQASLLTMPLFPLLLSRICLSSMFIRSCWVIFPPT